MKKIAILVLIFVLITTLILVSGCGSTTTLIQGNPNNPGNVVSTHTPILVPESQNLVNGAITVKANGSYYQQFTVTSSMRNPVVSGSFKASGGSGNDIIVYIFDSINYTNWSNGHQSSAFYNSGQVTVQNINTSLAPGSYYLVFDNTFSTLTSKVVTTTINLNYDVMQ